ncbi:phage tail length tape measure family protein [Roseomonas rosulenta]|uniref:phage tail length tape measure family protein n=1 Tax=Roseomonas rosulenta TaxID=2748667 RepID=UPI0018E05BF5|nr:phage tail length tape measure family protein [Roseomonas rosulenta]
MSGTMGGVELLSIIRSSLDASGYVAGARQVEGANERLRASGDKVAGSQERITRGMDQTARQVAALAQRTNPAVKATVELADAEAKLDRALKLGLISLDDHARLLVPLQQRHQAVTAAANQTANAFGVTARQAQQLAPQVNDVITSLLGGASAFQVLTQQGGQITQAMGGVGNTFRAIGGLFSPVRVGVLAVGGALIGTFAAYEGTERRVARLRNELRGYAADYESLARNLERRAREQSVLTPGAGRSEVRTAQARIAQVVRPEDRENLEHYVALALDLSRTLDKDLSAAAERVARALRRPEEVARELAEQGVRGFDEQFRRHIELMVRAGDASGAAAQVTARLTSVVQGATNGGTAFERAINNVEKSLEGLWNRITDGLTRAGGPFIDWLARSERHSRFLVEQGGLAVLQALPGGAPIALGLRLQQMLGPSAPGAQTTRAGPAADVATLLDEAARVSGVDRALLERVQRAEGVRNPDGSWRTSSAGARGPMQVMPGTFAELAGRYSLSGGIDDPRSNTIAGALYLRERLQARGDVALALADYNAGPGRVDRVLGGQAELPNETARYVRGIRSGYSGSGIAGPVQPVTPAAPSAPAAGAAANPQPASVAGPPTPTPEQRFYDSALSEVRRRGTPTGDVAELTRDLERFQRAQRQAAPDSVEYREFGDAIEQIRARITGTERPIEQFIRGQREAARIATTSEGAARELAQAMQGLEEAARAQGRDPTAEERAVVREAVLARAAGQYRNLTANVDRQIEAEGRLNEAMGRGAGAMQEAEARAKAMEDVRRAGLAGTEQEAAAVAELTERYLRLARAQADRITAASLDEQRRQIDLIRAEAGTIGLGERDRAEAIAAIRARAELERRSPGASDTDTGHQYVANAVDIARAQDDVRLLKEIEGYGRETAGVLVSGFRAIAFEGRRANDVLRDMERALLDLGTRALLLKPLEDALGRLASTAFSGGAGGGGGGLGGLLSLIGLGGSGPEIAGVGLAKGIEGAAGLVTAAAPLFHEGGVVGADPTPRRLVPEIFFHGAPRLHSGGFAGGTPFASDEVPAILRRGEVVLNRRQQQAVARAATPSVSQTIIVRAEDPAAFHRTRLQMAGAMRRDLARAMRNA